MCLRSLWKPAKSVALSYPAQVWFLRGFYIVTYALGIYVLNLVIGFLTPKHLQFEAAEDPADGPTLPTKADQEFRPFVRRLPEFKFWFLTSRALLIAFSATFFRLFDVPVFWPILLVYWVRFGEIGYTPIRARSHMPGRTPPTFDAGAALSPTPSPVCPRRHHNEATNSAHDPAQVLAVRSGKAGVQGARPQCFLRWDWPRRVVGPRGTKRPRIGSSWSRRSWGKS